MSKPPFTPGPWHAGDNHGCRQIKAKKSGEHKQGQWYYEVACTPGLSDDDEDKANARLIAAAPDLYEALREAHGVLRYYITEAGSIDDADSQLLARMVSALARARGQ